MENITMLKPKAKRVIGSESPLKKRKGDFDPRNINDRNVSWIKTKEIDILADITNGKFGLVILMQKPCDQNLDQVPDTIAHYEEVETSLSNLPKTINQVMDETSRSFDIFLKNISITEEQQEAVQKATWNSPVMILGLIFEKIA